MRPIEEYRRLLTELEFERTLRGGELPQEAELAYAERFELLWNAMSAEEQAALEAQLRAPVLPGVRREPNEKDCEVTLDSTSPPRRAA